MNERGLSFVAFLVFAFTALSPLAIGNTRPATERELHVKLTVATPKKPQSAVPSLKEEPELILYVVEKGCSARRTKPRGPCQRKDGVAGNSGVEVRCRTPKGTVKTNEMAFRSGGAMTTLLHGLHRKHAPDEDFPGCYRPEVFKAFAEEICALYCRKQLRTKKTSGLTYRFTGLEPALYFLEVKEKRLATAQHEFWAYALPIQQIDLRDESRSITPEIQLFEYIVD